MENNKSSTARLGDHEGTVFAVTSENEELYVFSWIPEQMTGGLDLEPSCNLFFLSITPFVHEQVTSLSPSFKYILWWV